MLAGWVFPFAAEPADDWAEMAREAAPPEPFFITTFGARGGAGFGAGASKTGFRTGAGSGFFTGAGGALAGGFVFTAGFLVGAGFLAGAFLADAGFFFEGAGFFLAGAFLGAFFLAMVMRGGSELFQFPRG